MITDAQRDEILELVRASGWGTPAIAHKLGLPVGTVANVRRANDRRKGKKSARSQYTDWRHDLPEANKRHLKALQASGERF